MEKSENLLSGRVIVDGPDGCKQLVDRKTGKVIERDYPTVIE